MQRSMPICSKAFIEKCVFGGVRSSSAPPKLASSCASHVSIRQHTSAYVSIRHIWRSVLLVCPPKTCMYMYVCECVCVCVSVCVRPEYISA
jgi:hypothetical protein